MKRFFVFVTLPFVLQSALLAAAAPVKKLNVLFIAVPGQATDE